MFCCVRRELMYPLLGLSHALSSKTKLQRPRQQISLLLEETFVSMEDFVPTVSCAVESLRIVIVGGGLGGLATALALQRGGHSAIVLERAPAFPPVSAQRFTS